jgi:hypothetical protein
MNKAPLRSIADQEVERFWQDGAICLHGLFDPDWVTSLQEATAAAMANPGSLATGRNSTDRQTFYVELGLWSAHAAFQDLSSNPQQPKSPAASFAPTK